jgi:hypothetical protein
MDASQEVPPARTHTSEIFIWQLTDRMLCVHYAPHLLGDTGSFTTDITSAVTTMVPPVGVVAIVHVWGERRLEVQMLPNGDDDACQLLSREWSIEKGPSKLLEAISCINTPPCRLEVRFDSFRELDDAVIVLERESSKPFQS